MSQLNTYCMQEYALCKPFLLGYTKHRVAWFTDWILAWSKNCFISTFYECESCIWVHGHTHSPSYNMYLYKKNEVKRFRYYKVARRSSIIFVGEGCEIAEVPQMFSLHYRRMRRQSALLVLARNYSFRPTFITIRVPTSLIFLSWGSDDMDGCLMQLRQ